MTNPSTRKTAFDGIRVLDFTHVYAGPFATFQLGVMGAEVIKVEAPGNPDQMRIEGVDDELNRQGLGTTYIMNNQGKQAIALDIACADGYEIATQLITPRRRGSGKLLRLAAQMRIGARAGTGH